MSALRDLALRWKLQQGQIGIVNVLRDARSGTNRRLAVSENVPRQTKGPAQTFYRKRFDEAALMGALESPARDPNIDAAWAALSAL